MLRRHLDQEIAQHTERYQGQSLNSQALITPKGQRAMIEDQQILSELESVRVRLELEAESLIEQAVTVFQTNSQNFDA